MKPTEQKRNDIVVAKNHDLFMKEYFQEKRDQKSILHLVRAYLYTTEKNERIQEIYYIYYLTMANKLWKWRSIKFKWIRGKILFNVQFT
jgi:hypothetical protein